MRKLNKLLAVLFAFALLAAACGRAATAKAAVDTSAIDEANAAATLLAPTPTSQGCRRSRPGRCRCRGRRCPGRSRRARADADGCCSDAADLHSGDAPAALPFAGQVVRDLRSGALR